MYAYNLSVWKNFKILNRDKVSSIAYSDQLNSTTSSATLKSADRRHDIVGQKCSDFQRDS